MPRDRVLEPHRGVRHRLRVIERPGRAHVEVDGERLLLYVPEGPETEARLAVLQRWQRAELRRRLPMLVAQWEPNVGRMVSKWSVCRMKTKWGACNRKTGHLWFNLELAKKHPDCLEYIVVHEMAHLVEPSHGKRFVSLMDKLLPDWRTRRDALNRSPLAEETWA
jgi:predicted metal-dependent hydrolase